MSEHVVLLVDRLVASTAANGDSVSVGKASFSTRKSSPPTCNRLSLQKSFFILPDESGFRTGSALDGDLDSGEESIKPVLNAGDEAMTPLLMDLATAECRICQEEDDIGSLESPCACTGSLKYAHRKCVQRWCNEKGDTVCEICRKTYDGGYTAPPSSARADNLSINIGGSWDIATGGRLDLHESRLFSVASDNNLLDSDYEEYTRANARTAACFRLVAFMLMVLLLLRHIFSMTSTAVEDDVSTFVMFFLLRAVGFFLPCYVLARAFNALPYRRERQEAALAAAEVAYLLQAGGHAHGVSVAESA